jgi:hypothetical protein
MDSDKIGDDEQMCRHCRHLDSHGGAMEQYRWHRPMQNDQGHTKCPWTPPLNDYSLHIAPAATRATANKTTFTNAPTLLAIRWPL